MDLDALRSGYRKLRRVSTFTALAYFVLFLIFSAFTPDMMTSEITGGLNIGLVLGLCQLPVALAAIALYERIARNRIDPLSATIQEQTLQAAQDSRSPRRRHVPARLSPRTPLGRSSGRSRSRSSSSGSGRTGPSEVAGHDRIQLRRPDHVADRVHRGHHGHAAGLRDDRPRSRGPGRVLHRLPLVVAHTERPRHRR
ncbi:DUF485 domain-containing protein [Streptomyces agglomeratus]|uniref:DUF485 domain-containing protein n=1 Tax=Streptomyces agglomeratus TaxID=285458 RepID=UPI001F0ABC18|nr:DUF485 domain-containing protein [Streptomyces agglomeratus]